MLPSDCFVKRRTKGEYVMNLSERLKRKSNSMDMFATAGTIGLHMVTGPAVGFGLGYGAEALCASMGFDIAPWGKLVGFFIGIGGGFLSVYEDSQRLLRKMDDKKTVGDASTSAAESAPSTLDAKQSTTQSPDDTLQK